jgi:hypothetical protein
MVLWNPKYLHVRLSSDRDVANNVSPSTMEKTRRGGEGASSSLLREISVKTLVLRRSRSIAANLIRLLGIHAQHFGKRQQSCNG